MDLSDAAHICIKLVILLTRWVIREYKKEKLLKTDKTVFYVPKYAQILTKKFHVRSIISENGGDFIIL